VSAQPGRIGSGTSIRASSSDASTAFVPIDSTTAAERRVVAAPKVCWLTDNRPTSR
jgi:hypothetical protein